MTNDNFEFYSQKGGRERKGSVDWVRAYMGLNWDSEVLGGVPSSSGNTENLNEIREASNGDLWFIDKDGDGLNFNDYFLGVGGAVGLWEETGTRLRTLTSGRRVLIGQTAAGIGAGNLEVTNRVDLNPDGTSSSFVMWSPSNNNASMSMSDTGFRLLASKPIRFGWSGNQDMFVVNTNLEKIGIETDTPTQLLDVNGAMRLRGHLFDSTNNSGTTGQFLSRVASGVDWVDEPAGTDTNIKTTNFTFDNDRENDIDGFLLEFKKDTAIAMRLNGVDASSGFGGLTQSVTRMSVYGIATGSIVKMFDNSSSQKFQFKNDGTAWFDDYDADDAVTGTAVARAGFDADGKVLTMPIYPELVEEDADSDNYNVDADSDIIWCDDDTAGEAILVNVPSIASVGNKKQYYKKIGSTGTVTLNANGAQTIDGVGTLDLTSQYDGVVIYPRTSTDWAIVAVMTY